MKKHGEVQLHWDDETLYVETFGPFNEEGVEDAIVKYINELESRKGALFSIIEIWDEQTLGSPNVLNAAKKFWHNLDDEYGCIRLALVVQKNMQDQIAQKMIPKIGKIFLNLEEAEHWAKKKKEE